MARSDRTTRRRFLASLATGATVLGGCTALSNSPRYESGEVTVSNNTSRTASEMSAAAALAQTQVNENATPLDSLVLGTHEFVVADGYKGPTVQGTVTNDGDDSVTFVEVRVRVYDENGAHLGRYLASTGDIDAGATWQFEVILLASAADIAEYDIAVLGIPQ